MIYGIETSKGDQQEDRERHHVSVWILLISFVEEARGEEEDTREGEREAKEVNSKFFG